uniref:Uncharacterized protein n=1 Tax=Leersia perrieri TaxID=77586 RepID=A0A0D9V148_9ORYZ
MAVALDYGNSIRLRTTMAAPAAAQQCLRVAVKDPSLHQCTLHFTPHPRHLLSGSTRRSLSL